MYWGHPYRHTHSRLAERDVPEYSDIVARDESFILAARAFDDSDIEARSFEDMGDESLAKRTASASIRPLRRRSFFGKLKKGLKNAVKSVGRGVKKAANSVRKVAHTIKKGIHKVGTGIKKAAHWIKKNGATMAKVGFKFAAMATKVASHAVAVIPGIGKAAGRALSSVSQVADYVSSKIPAKLSSKWQKTMNVFEKIQNPLGRGAAGKALDAILKRDESEEELLKRDFVEGEQLFERDVPALETRSNPFGTSAAGKAMEAIFKRDASEEELLLARDFIEGEQLWERDLPALELRSFEDSSELDARWLDDELELEARSWNFEEDEI
jgi:hypothetical protein